jgi:mannitol-1-phosphate/altronate dehydrogenase
MQRLSNAFLFNYIPHSTTAFEIPTYDRAGLRAGIVHFGPGNFPLAHIAAKTHELMQSGDEASLMYGIVAVSTQTRDRTDQLTAQDGLYTLAEQDSAGRNMMTIVGSVIGALFAPENPQAVVAQLASPDTRIVSMTVTPQTHQSYLNASGKLNMNNADIANDLNPEAAPKSVPGFIVRGVQARERAGLPGFTVMNLDNMEHNGAILRDVILQFAHAYDRDIIAAIENKYAFPNSMVDRIVPKTTAALLDQVKSKTGYIDMAAVPAEPMPRVGSWVIEDHFANGRPSWENLGLVQIVPDVLPYEQMKLRILNVSHSWMANLGCERRCESVPEKRRNRSAAAAQKCTA